MLNNIEGCDLICLLSVSFIIIDTPWDRIIRFTCIYRSSQNIIFLIFLFRFWIKWEKEGKSCPIYQHQFRKIVIKYVQYSRLSNLKNQRPISEALGQDRTYDTMLNGQEGFATGIKG